MITTLRIDRLKLDLRGIDPATAEAAVRLLGPALQAQMAMLTAAAQSGSSGQGPARSATPRRQSSGAARDHIDAGRVAAASEPQALAERLAERVSRCAAHGLMPPARKG